MEAGTKTGRFDDNGVEIKLGDTVSLYEFKEAHTDQYGQDGWGRSYRLRDPQKTPSKSKTTSGVVTYKPSVSGFVVEFDDYLLNSGKSAPLHMVGKSKYQPNDRILVT